MVLEHSDVHAQLCHFYHCMNNKSLGHHSSFKVNIPHVPHLFIHFLSGVSDRAQREWKMFSFL